MQFRAKRAMSGNMSSRVLRADFDIINYKYTIGGRRVCGILRIIGKSYKGGSLNWIMVGANFGMFYYI